MTVAKEQQMLEQLPALAAACAARPFHDLRLVVTGFEAEEREAVASCCEALGGAYASELARGACTHLVVACGAEGGAKAQHAARWGGVRLVTLSWLFDCARAGGASRPSAPTRAHARAERLDEGAYAAAVSAPPPPPVAAAREAASAPRPLSTCAARARVAPDLTRPSVSVSKPQWEAAELSGCRFFLDESGLEPHRCALLSALRASSAHAPRAAWTSCARWHGAAAGWWCRSAARRRTW